MDLVVGHTARTVLSLADLDFLQSKEINPDHLLELAVDHLVDYADDDEEYFHIKFEENAPVILDLKYWDFDISQRVYPMFLKLIHAFKSALDPILLPRAEEEFEPVHVIDFGNEHQKRVVLRVRSFG